MAQYYIIYNGQSVGPVDKYELPNYQLTPDSQVWTEGMAQWQPASTVPDLNDLLCPQPPRYGNEPAPGYGQQQQYGCPPRNQYQQGYYNPSMANQGMPNQGMPNQGMPNQGMPGQGMPPSDKSNVAAGLFAIFLGTLGVQYFYLGKSQAGLIVLLTSLITCGGMACIWGLLFLIQGIIMLTMSQQQFDSKYVYNPSTFPFF